MSTGLSVLIILTCVLGEAFFSGSEIGMISSDKLRLRHAAKSGNRTAHHLLDMLKNPEWILGTTLLGTNICTVINTTIAASLFYRLLGAPGIAVSIVVISMTNWIFGEIVPKSVFQQLGQTIALKITPVIRFFSFIFAPVVWLFSRLATLISAPFGGNPVSTQALFKSKEEIRLLIKISEDKGDVKPSERNMIRRLLTFNETRTDGIMVPLIDVAALIDTATIDEATRKFVETKHRRLPVYSERIDRIVGLLNSFDILAENPANSIRPYIRQPFYIPQTMNVSALLEQFQTNAKNMAIVVDEYGGAVGIVTIEDILEVVVGDIEDEYDAIRQLYQVQRDGSIIVTGRMEIEDLNERFELNLPEGEYETVGGFMIYLMKKIPSVGEKIVLPNLILTVRKATERVVEEVLLQKVIRKDDAMLNKTDGQ